MLTKNKAPVLESEYIAIMLGRDNVHNKLKGGSDQFSNYISETDFGHNDESRNRHCDGKSITEFPSWQRHSGIHLIPETDTCVFLFLLINMEWKQGLNLLEFCVTTLNSVTIYDDSVS